MADALQRMRMDFRKVDVDADPELRARFGMRVPVLAGEDGAPICEGRVDPEALRTRLGLE